MISRQLQHDYFQKRIQPLFLGGYFHFGNYHHQLFGISELLTVPKMEIALLEKRNFRFFLYNNIFLNRIFPIFAPINHQTEIDDLKKRKTINIL